MGVSSIRSSPKKRRSVLVERLDELLKQREAHLVRIKAANAKKVAKMRKVDAQWREDVGTAPQQLEVVDKDLTAFMVRHHYQLTRSLTKTIKRELGEVKVVLRAKELEVPGSETPIINFLLKRSGGKRYLTLTWKVNRRALLQAPSQLLSLLAPFGVWRGQHRMISVKSALDDRAQTLSQTRYNERKN